MDEEDEVTGSWYLEQNREETNCNCQDYVSIVEKKKERKSSLAFVVICSRSRIK